MVLYYLFLGIAPTFLWLWFFYRKDRWEPEPKSKVLKIFALGFVAIIPALLLTKFFQKVVFDIDPYMMNASLTLNVIVCFLIVGPIEELLKYSVVKTFMFYDNEFDEKLDGVIYMVAAALGFAAFETLLYIFKIRDPRDATILAGLRAVLAVPAHICFSGIFGIFLGKARFAKTYGQRIYLIAGGYIVAVLLHGTYDAFTFLARPYSYGSIVFVVILFVILLKQVDKLSAQSRYRPKQ